MQMRAWWWIAVTAVALWGPLSVRAQPALPAGLPIYDLNIRVDPEAKLVRVRQRVTFTNTTQRPATELVFNVFPHYKIASKDIGLAAKTIEILRTAPGEALDTEGRRGNVDHVRLLTPGVAVAGQPAPAQAQELAATFRPELDTALDVKLPRPVGPGEQATVELDYVVRLPELQGRWGVYEGVTFLTQWLPVLAVYDDTGWHPVPFIPWHQPFWQEAGIYSARIRLPATHKLACSGPVSAVEPAADGFSDHVVPPTPLRDFSLTASARYQVYEGEAGGIQVKVLAFPEHEFYAREMVKIACEALPTYTRWFGAYPYKQFTVAESCFPWNGNECAGLVMIDHRVFMMPKIARPYVDYLLSHEICHQWWYSAVGTNGYAETFMDEALATYCSHRLLDAKVGKNNPLIEYPSGLQWLPTVYRENYRYASMYGTIRRDEMSPAVAPMESYGHIINLFSATYDRGSKIIGMIENRLGEAAFLDFLRTVYRKYRFRILRVADFQRELEAHTGQSWDEFFQRWVYGKGLVDWAVNDVTSRPLGGPTFTPDGIPQPPRSSAAGVEVTVILEQRREYDEPTTVGFKLGDGLGYQVRVPVVPRAGKIDIADPPATVEALPDHRVRVVVHLPSEPTQVMVDPDHVLQDADPANNCWHIPHKWRLTPLYTTLDETDLTTDFDGWNFMAGPWFYTSAGRDPWYTRSTFFGLRAGAYRAHEFSGGGFVAYRNDYRDIVVGADATFFHWPVNKAEVGFNIESRVAGPFGTNGPQDVTKAVVYGRYIFNYSSSLYLGPMQYAEAFATYQDNGLPFARTVPPGGERPDNLTAAGLHYRLDYLTPYWDPEGGFRFDAAYMGGTVDFPSGHDPLNRIESQFTIAKRLPEGLGWLSETKVAARVVGAGAWPDRGLHYALGGSTLFRGFDLAERQGSAYWVGNLEWRVPLVKGVNWDCVDHVVGFKSVYLNAFYDVGGIYDNGHLVDNVAQAVGVGVRVDVTWFSLIERSMFRVDVAKTVNAASPVQVWVGLSHAF